MKPIWLLFIAPAVLSPSMGHANSSNASSVVSADWNSPSSPPVRVDQVPVTATGNWLAGAVEPRSGAASHLVLAQSRQLQSTAGSVSSKTIPARSSIASRTVPEIRRRMLTAASMLRPYDILLMLLVLFGLAAFQLRRMQDALYRPFADR